MSSTQLIGWQHTTVASHAGIRFAVSAFLVTIAALLFAAGRGGWATLPLVGAGLNLALGYWEMTVARSAVPRA